MIASADMILFKPEHVQPILEGRKTQTRRIGDKRWRVGAVHQCKSRLFGSEPFARVRILSVRRERLGDMSVSDVAREGYKKPTDFRVAWEAIYGAPFDDDLKVWVVEFELVRE